MAGTQEDIFLFIADISGYTAFMLNNQAAYTHGTLVITELMETLIKHIDIPFKISKLEGDAVFFYLLKESITHEMSEDPLYLGRKLLEFFSLFSTKLEELEISTACKCGGCANIDKLDLKIIVHYGKASIIQISTFSELSGVDVILAHRLLKNHIQGHRYMAFTQKAHNQILLPREVQMDEEEENIPDMGTFRIYVCFPPMEKEGLEPSKWRELKTHFNLFVGTSMLKWGMKKLAPFRNLPPPP